MSLQPLFVDDTGGLDLEQVVSEAVPIAYLIGTFATAALVPFLLGLLLGPGGIAIVFSILAQFVLAVGSAVVLLYVVSRALQLHEQRQPPATEQ